MARSKGFWTQLMEALAPPENRLIAAVAFTRTFVQGLTGSAFVSAGGSLLLNATDILTADWQTLALAALATGLSASISGLNAYFNVLSNGLSPKYAEAMAAMKE